MSTEREAELASLLEQNGLGWALRGEADAESRILGRIAEAAAEYKRRFGTEIDLLAAARAKPDEMRAFLQTLSAGVTPSFLAMVARILLRGAAIKSVRFDLVSSQSMSLEVEIQDVGGQLHAFKSTELWDAQVVRHFGLMKAGGLPVIDGYYASRTGA